jgi:hypothetical protein
MQFRIPNIVFRESPFATEIFLCGFMSHCFFEATNIVGIETMGEGTVLPSVRNRGNPFAY